MIDPAVFPIARKWPAKFPDRIQLYSLPTPNGVKVSIMLEEVGLAYEPHLVRFATNDHKTPEFQSLSPYRKIPAIIDPNGPEGQPIGLFESGAILIYLAEKTGKLIGSTAAQKYKTIQWLMFQMGGVGPMFGQMGFFVKFAGSEIEDPRPRDRYIAEAKRLLAVLEQELAGQDWITGEFSIADIALAPWVNSLEFYGAKPLVGWDDMPNLQAYVARFYARPAVVKAKSIPKPA